MPRTYNFSAGPSVLPVAALERAQREMLDWAGTGACAMRDQRVGRLPAERVTRRT